MVVGFVVGLILASVAAGTLIWLASTDAGEDAPVTSAAMAPAPGEPPAALAPNSLQTLAVLRERDPTRILPITERHRLLAAVAETADARRLDRGLHAALDLVQADQSATPCSVFERALTRLERDPRPDLADLIAAATVPSGGHKCEALASRHHALVASLNAPTPTAAPESEPGDVAPDDPVEPEPERRKRRTRRSRPKPAPRPVEPEAAGDPVPVSTPPESREPVADKLGGGLRPIE